MTHRLVRAAWVGDDLLLMAAAPGAGAPPDPAGAEPVAAAGRAAAGPGDELVLAVRVPERALGEPAARLRAEAGDVVVETDAGELRTATADLRGFLGEHAAAWDARSRAALIETVLELLVGEPQPVSRAEGLRELRDALRERRPLALVDERVDRAVGVERLHRLADDAFYAAGWVWEPSGPLTALTAVSPEGERVELAELAFRHPREDIGERFGAPADRRGGEPAGFVCHFTTRVPSVLSEGWVIEGAGAGGPGVEAPVELTSADPDAALAPIVEDAGLDWAQAERLREDHVRPAIARLQRARAARALVEHDEVLGTPPPSPRVSVIVPLFGRTDLLEHQLVQFAADPAMAECELVYVLDSPEQRDHLRDYASQLFELHGLPFRVVSLAANGGVSIARAAGAARASGELLLFLDSDVIPDRPGWLPRLADAFAAEPRTGAIGPKLVHEDDTVQSAGVVFERAAGAGEWELRHRLKGMHRAAAAAAEPAVVPAVTGACLMSSADALSVAGGWSGEYVQGDYEDADLCLRLAAAGLAVRYEPGVELYHLEGQSYVSDARAANRRHNRWLFNRLWRESLELGS